MSLKVRSLLAFLCSASLLFTGSVSAHKNTNSRIKPIQGISDDSKVNDLKVNKGKSKLNNKIKNGETTKTNNKKNIKSGDKSKAKAYYTVTYNFNDGVTPKKTVNLKAGEKIKFISLPEMRGNFYFLGWHIEKNPKDYTKGIDILMKPIDRDLELYAIWIDMKTDSDGNGLLDWEEKHIGKDSDPHNPDTDGDGLSDREEYECFSSPTNPHTFKDNVLDSDIDIDEDGLTAKEEVEFGSNVLFKDWDSDKLDDFQEKKYKTNPNNPDTDKDGLLDGLEIKYGFNPKKADTDNDGILDGDEIISVTMSYDESDWITKPSAKVRLKAKYTEDLSIERDNPDTSIWMNEDVPGFLDSMYNFTASGDIEEAILIFKFDEKYKKTDKFKPTIYHIDIENQKMLLLKNQVIDWDKHTVTAKVKYLSNFALLDKNEQDKAWDVYIHP